MPLKVAIFTAYVASSGSYWANGQPAVYSPKQCVLAAGPNIPLGTTVEVQFPKGKVKCVVKDRIGKPQGPYHFDLMLPATSDAIKFGRRKFSVYY